MGFNVHIPILFWGSFNCSGAGSLLLACMSHLNHAVIERGLRPALLPPYCCFPLLQDLNSAVFGFLAILLLASLTSCIFGTHCLIWAVNKTLKNGSSSRSSQSPHCASDSCIFQEHPSFVTQIRIAITPLSYRSDCILLRGSASDFSSHPEPPWGVCAHAAGFLLPRI